MMSEIPEPGMTPPTIADPLEAPPSKWPTVIGVISLIYALGGLLCQLWFGAWMLLGANLPEQFRGGITVPHAIKMIGLVQVTLTMIVGVVLLVSAIKLLGRRRAGPSMMRAWAMARVVLIVIGVLVAVLTAPAQIQMQRDSVEWQKRFFAERNMTQTIPEYTDEELWRKAILNTGIMSGVLALYPVFIVLYLSRKKIMAEVQEWR